MDQNLSQMFTERLRCVYCYYLVNLWLSDDVVIVECRPFEEEKPPIIGKLPLSPWFILLVPQ